MNPTREWPQQPLEKNGYFEVHGLPAINPFFHVTVSGTIQDRDGNPETTDDQSPFTETMETVTQAQELPIQVNPITTGLTLACDENYEHFDTFIFELPDPLKDFTAPLNDYTDSYSNIATLESMINLTKLVGYTKIVEELSDDGLVNESKHFSPTKINNESNVAHQKRLEGTWYNKTYNGDNGFPPAKIVYTVAENGESLIYDGFDNINGLNKTTDGDSITYVGKDENWNLKYSFQLFGETVYVITRTGIDENGKEYQELQGTYPNGTPETANPYHGKTSDDGFPSEFSRSYNYGSGLYGIYYKDANYSGNFIPEEDPEDPEKPFIDGLSGDWVINTTPVELNTDYGKFSFSLTLEKPGTPSQPAQWNGEGTRITTSNTEEDCSVSAIEYFDDDDTSSSYQIIINLSIGEALILEVSSTDSINTGAYRVVTAGNTTPVQGGTFDATKQS